MSIGDPSDVVLGGVSVKTIRRGWEAPAHSPQSIAGSGVLGKLAKHWLIG